MLNVLKLGLLLPVPLCWEINDVFRVDHSIGGECEHESRLNFSLSASICVCLEVISERLLELEGDAFAHNTHTIYGINKGFHIGVEYVALCKLNHDSLLLIIPVSAYLNYWLMPAALKHPFHPRFDS